MTAHAGSATTVRPPIGVPIRVRRPRPRFVLGLVALVIVVLVALAPGRAAELAHDACTLGNPEHVTCAEALVLLGYP